MVKNTRRKRDARQWQHTFGGNYRDALRATAWPSGMQLRIDQPKHLLT